MLFVLFFGETGMAQGMFTVTRNTPEALVSGVIKGSGVRVRNVRYTGSLDAIGEFDCKTQHPAFERGLILSTGLVTHASGPNENPKVSTALGGVGERKMDAIAKTRTFDAAVLEFEFMADKDSVAMRFIFASDEYAENVGSTFNDPILVHVSGPGLGNGKNLATVPGNPNAAINISTINITENKRWYVDNNPFTLAGKPNPVRKSELDLNVLQAFQYDGMTKPIEVGIKVIPKEVYRMRIAIADAGDGNFDSALLVDQGSFRSLEQSKHMAARELKREKAIADSLARVEAIADSLAELETETMQTTVQQDSTKAEKDDERIPVLDEDDEEGFTEIVEEDSAAAAQPDDFASSPKPVEVEQETVAIDSAEPVKPEYYVVLFEDESYFVPKDQEALLGELGQLLKAREDLQLNIFIPKTGDPTTNDMRFDMVRLEILKGGARPTQIIRSNVSFSMGTIQPMHRAELMVQPAE